MHIRIRLALAPILLLSAMYGICGDQPTTVLDARLPLSEEPFAKITALGEAIGDKRIVMLDELTHGEGSTFSLKYRLIQYLHEYKGFDALILESGIYDVSRIWLNAKESTLSQASGNIFYMYANSAEFRPVFEYIDKQRLQVSMGVSVVNCLRHNC